MTDLRTLQLRFAAYLNDRRESAILDDIVGDEKADAGVRMGIYYDAYRLRLIGVLQTDYPGLYLYLGDKAFAALVLAYLKACPPCSRSVRHFGVRLPEFIRDNASRREDAALLYELALFEKLQNDVFDEADAEPISGAQLAAVPAEAWGGLCLRLIPACRLLRLQYAIPQLWRLLQDKDEAPLRSQEPAQATDWLVWRKQLEPHWRALAADEAVAVRALQDGASFAGVCEQLAELMPASEVPPRAVAILRRLISDGLIAGLTSAGLTDQPG
ncbi:DNA-binding domain-containing protein [Granulosicoccaceae sp. 1_MG-2023]|nr:DNA-binding domain-containing protein [Granulosicoccaceae sp. 1_MG-2023]